MSIRISSEERLLSKGKIHLSRVAVHLGEENPSLPKNKQFLSSNGVKVFVVYNETSGKDTGLFFFTNEYARHSFNLDTAPEEEYEKLSSQDAGAVGRTLNELVKFLKG